MTFQNVLDTFFLTEDQDAFARSMGWEDAAQMAYYEGRDMSSPTDSEVDALAEREFLLHVQQLPPPPPSLFVRSQELHELESVDCREVYGEDMSLAGVY